MLQRARVPQVLRRASISISSPPHITVCRGATHTGHTRHTMETCTSSALGFGWIERYVVVVVGASDEVRSHVLLCSVNAGALQVIIRCISGHAGGCDVPLSYGHYSSLVGGQPLVFDRGLSAHWTYHSTWTPPCPPFCSFTALWH